VQGTSKQQAARIICWEWQTWEMQEQELLTQSACCAHQCGEGGG
jgi:hypothetical protein